MSDLSEAKDLSCIKLPESRYTPYQAISWVVDSQSRRCGGSLGRVRKMISDSQQHFMPGHSFYPAFSFPITLLVFSTV